MPNAHLSFRRGTSAAVSRAAAAGWKRVFARSGPQPFHPGPLAGSRIGGLAVHWFGIAFASPLLTLPSGRPLMNSATRCFWMSLSDCPSVCVGDLRPATIRSGVICRIAYAVVLALVADVAVTAETLLLEGGPAALGAWSAPRVPREAPAEPPCAGAAAAAVRVAPARPETRCT